MRSTPFMFNWQAVSGEAQAGVLFFHQRFESSNLKKEAKHWHTTAVLAENEAYWQLATHSNQAGSSAQ